MTISGESIRKIEFREGWRGYNQVDVDVFLEEVAADVDELHATLGEAKARAERAETRVTAPGVTPETDETVRRTLTLAQRAADLVVSESKAVAERRIRFFTEHRSYIINYSFGEDIVADYVAKTAGEDPAARWKVFTEILSSPRTPANLL